MGSDSPSRYIIASLERTALDRGIVYETGYSNHHFRGELLSSRSDTGHPQWREYSLTQNGKAFAKFLERLRLDEAKGRAGATT